MFIVKKFSEKARIVHWSISSLTIIMHVNAMRHQDIMRQYIGLTKYTWFSLVSVILLQWSPIIVQSLFSNILTTDIPCFVCEGKIWVVFCEFIVWFMSSRFHGHVVCNIMLYDHIGCNKLMNREHCDLYTDKDCIVSLAGNRVTKMLQMPPAVQPWPKKGSQRSDRLHRVRIGSWA